MCVAAKRNQDSLVSRDLNLIEQLWDELLRCDASVIVQSNLGILDSFRLLSFKNGARRYVLSIRPSSGACIASGESHARFFYEFNSSKLNLIHSPVKNLSFLKMTHCLYTGVQHERI